jgi:hypothetical protein
MTPDEVCRRCFDSKIQIRVTEKENTIFIEGTRDSLMFLSKLVAAQAGADDDGFQLSPFGAGSAWFAAGSTKGIYLHRTPEKSTSQA